MEKKQSNEDHNLILLEKLILRIKEALEKKQNTTLKIEVEVKDGIIKSISWDTKFSINFL